MTKIVRTLATLAAGWLLAAPAFACPVCYGEAEGAVIDGAKLSVLFLGALVYLLIGGGVALAVVAHRRAVKNLDPRRGMRLSPPQGN